MMFTLPPLLFSSPLVPPCPSIPLLPLLSTELFSARVDGNMFRRKDRLDQQVVSRISVPAPIMEIYKSCEAPPALNEMNPFRDDGKISLNFFTDPDYFFRLWCEEMREETEREQQKKKKKKVSWCVSQEEEGRR